VTQKDQSFEQTPYFGTHRIRIVFFTQTCCVNNDSTKACGNQKKPKLNDRNEVESLWVYSVR
jgi:hypothetical protein